MGASRPVRMKQQGLRLVGSGQLRFGRCWTDAQYSISPLTPEISQLSLQQFFLPRESQNMSRYPLFVRDCCFRMLWASIQLPQQFQIGKTISRLRRGCHVKLDPLPQHLVKKVRLQIFLEIPSFSVRVRRHTARSNCEIDLLVRHPIKDIPSTHLSMLSKPLAGFLYRLLRDGLPGHGVPEYTLCHEPVRNPTDHAPQGTAVRRRRREGTCKQHLGGTEIAGLLVVGPPSTLKPFHQKCQTKGR
mmetsp:Transcript_33833/g.88006  ORF Transcript_33833/g.88006 Transcript_33833/m.88006 type:complete len:244 (+) Transcript_33833:2015-2746(+)